MIWSISDFRDIAERLRTRRGAHSSSPKDWHGQRSNEAQWGKKRTSAPKCYCIWDVMPKNFEGRGKGSLLAGELYFALKRMRKTSTTSGTVANMATSNPAQLVINAAVFCVKKVMTICKSFTDRGPNNLSHIRCVENCFSTRVCAAFPNRLHFPASCKRVMRANESDSMSLGRPKTPLTSSRITVGKSQTAVAIYGRMLAIPSSMTMGKSLLS